MGLLILSIIFGLMGGGWARADQTFEGIARTTLDCDSAVSKSYQDKQEWLAATWSDPEMPLSPFLVFSDEEKIVWWLYTMRLSVNGKIRIAGTGVLLWWDRETTESTWFSLMVDGKDRWPLTLKGEIDRFGPNEICRGKVEIEFNKESNGNQAFSIGHDLVNGIGLCPWSLLRP